MSEARFMNLAHVVDMDKLVEQYKSTIAAPEGYEVHTIDYFYDASKGKICFNVLVGRVKP